MEEATQVSENGRSALSSLSLPCAGARACRGFPLGRPGGQLQVAVREATTARGQRAGAPSQRLCQRALALALTSPSLGGEVSAAARGCH